jgi:superfamily II DNA or RNA helicase
MEIHSEGILLESTSWQSFKSALESLTEKQKGDCFEVLTKLFLQLNPQYSTKIKQIWLLKNVPASIREHLNLPDPDEGIDLIAETKDKEYWAIQCKYLGNEDKRLTRAIINSFTDLAFTVCKNISFALVCTTADRYSHKLSMYGERLGFCSGDTWRQLDEEFFEQVHEFLTGRLLPLSPAVPRDHQKEAITEAASYFADTENSRGKFIMPCGTGKSLASYWIAEALNAQSVLVAVPSLALIRQSLEVWTRESIANKRDIDWMCVCSDETVSDIERDDAVVLTQDLGIRVHTNPDEIAEWLKENSNGNRVVFSTYQSGKAIAEASGKAGIVFDLGIFDEAHKTVGKVDSLFSHLLHDENIPIEKRVFMTATERRYLGQGEQIASMDNPSLYGDTFYLLSFKKALEAEPPILCDYKIVTMIVEKSEIYELIRQNVFVKPDRGKWDEEVEAEMLAAAVALRKAMIKNPIRHAVSFHNSVARAKAFKVIQDKLTEEFPQYGDLDVFHVSGKTPTGRRAREIESFAHADRGLITNARCLTEGVDVPNIDCVLFADPKKSTVDIVQAIGRALRPSPNKQRGYIIIPVVLDSGNGRESHGNVAFSYVLAVLRALAANDDRIIEYFRAISKGRKSTGGIIDFGIDVLKGVSLNAEEFISSIELTLWSRLAKLAWRPFEEGREFAHQLDLKSVKEWNRFCKGLLPEKGRLPKDIPADPHHVYNECWKSWGDWLGTGTIASQFRQYRPFERAREFVRNLGLKSQFEWYQFRKGLLTEKGTLPNDIPANPNQTYRDQGWRGMGDWLGTGTIAPQFRQYRPFEKARDFAGSLGLKNREEWNRFCKGLFPEKGTLPSDIPANPYKTYRDQGWKGMGDWLGTGAIAFFLREYRPFKEAREFARGLGLKGQSDWYKFCKGLLPKKGTLPNDIPAVPPHIYREQGWKSWGDWLGTGTIAPGLREYRPFKEAREFVGGLGLKKEEEWRKFCKGLLPEKGTLPGDIPFRPDYLYRNDGWKSWGDWLGTGTIAPRLREYRPFEEAREFVHQLDLKNVKEWNKFCKGLLSEKGTLPNDIPADPHNLYREQGWKSWGDWLGTGTIAPRLREYRPFGEAREFARQLALKNFKEWMTFCKGHLAEKGTLPNDIPSNPNVTYKNDGWKGWGDWLGTGVIAFRFREYRPFEEAREYIRQLGIKNFKEWQKFCKGDLPEKGMLPSDISSHPNVTYKSDGWKNMGDWLGTGTISTHFHEYRPFKEAREFTQSLGLKSGEEWHRFCKGLLPKKGRLPGDIPTNPHRTYKSNGWKGMGDWLGTGTIAPRLREYRPFEEARDYVHNLNLKSTTGWRKFCKGQLPEKGTLPEDIPANPNQTYENKGWKGMGDWLGVTKGERLL